MKKEKVLGLIMKKKLLKSMQTSANDEVGRVKAVSKKHGEYDECVRAKILQVRMTLPLL